MTTLSPETTLSELREILRSAPVDEVESLETLARSVEQSLRVEGHAVSHADVFSAAGRVLGLEIGKE